MAKELLSCDYSVKYCMFNIFCIHNYLVLQHKYKKYIALYLKKPDSELMNQRSDR
jgi:hypothetical protein